MFDGYRRCTAMNQHGNQKIGYWQNNSLTPDRKPGTNLSVTIGNNISHSKICAAMADADSLRNLKTLPKEPFSQSAEPF